MAAHQKRRDNDTGAVDGQAREAQEPPALTDGGGSMHQDQGAQVDDVPVVDDAVDESTTPLLRPCPSRAARWPHRPTPWRSR